MCNRAGGNEALGIYDGVLQHVALGSGMWGWGLWGVEACDVRN